MSSDDRVGLLIKVAPLNVNVIKNYTKIILRSGRLSSGINLLNKWYIYGHLNFRP
jgi:hypothetical protein